MSHFPYSLCPSFSEENPGSHFDKLRILDKSKYIHGLTTPTYYLFLLPEHDAGLVAALHPLDWVYPLYDGCLPDVAYMHCGSEPSQYLCRVEQDADISLEILASHRLFNVVKVINILNFFNIVNVINVINVVDVVNVVNVINILNVFNINRGPIFFIEVLN